MTRAMIVVSALPNSVSRGCRPDRVACRCLVERCRGVGTKDSVTSANRSPTRSRVIPSRRYADCALGLAYDTTPLAAVRTKPSPTCGDTDQSRRSTWLGNGPG